MSAEDGILEYGDLKKMAHTAWAMFPLLMQKSMSLLHAHQGAMKSMIAMFFGHTMAYGLPFGDGPPAPRGLVLYLAYEGFRGLPQRRRAAMKHMKLRDTDMDALKLLNPLPYAVDGVKGLDIDLLNTDATLRFIMLAIKMSNDQKLPIACVIVDVLQVAVKYQENTKTFGLYLENVRRIIEALDCHVMTLHHNKSESKNARGPVMLSGACETVLHQELDGMDISITSTKQREGDSKIVHMFRAHKTTLGFDEDEIPISSIGITYMGVAMANEVRRADVSSYLYQIAASMVPGSRLSVTALVKLMGWSADGKGGRQHEQVLTAVPEIPLSVHIEGDDYRLVWREREGSGWTIHCATDTREAEKRDEPLAAASVPTTPYKPPPRAKSALETLREAITPDLFDVQTVVPQPAKALPQTSEPIPPPPPPLSDEERAKTDDVWKSVLPQFGPPPPPPPAQEQEQEQPAKRGRGRPKGSQDSTPRKAKAKAAAAPAAEVDAEVNGATFPGEDVTPSEAPGEPPDPAGA
jgi:hypothetical protein